MTDKKTKKVAPVRLTVRVHIPKIDPEYAGEVHAAITEALANFPDVEIELSLLPVLVTR